MNAKCSIIIRIMGTVCVTVGIEYAPRFYIVLGAGRTSNG